MQTAVLCASGKRLPPLPPPNSARKPRLAGSIIAITISSQALRNSSVDPTVDPSTIGDRVPLLVVASSAAYASTLAARAVGGRYLNLNTFGLVPTLDNVGDLVVRT